jgi:arylsulfatase A-like enzyme
LRDAGYLTANLRKLPPEFGFDGTAKTDWNFTVEKEVFESRDWDDLKTKQPFFAQLNFHETHRKFNGARLADPAKVPLPPYYPDHPVAREDYARYLDAVMELDRKVGLVLQRLAADGLADNTIVIFMGDNGEAHVRGKQFCYEEGLHVPLIIRWPEAMPAPAHFAPGSVDTRLIEAIDIAPTLLSLVGAPIPDGMQGRPFLGEKTGAPKQFVFGARDRCDETAMRIRTVRDVRYRYIRNFTPEVPLLAPNAYKAQQYPVWNLLQELNRAGQLTPVQAALCAPRLPDEELYDLEADPHEIQNLAASKQPEHQAALKRLREELERWIKDTDDKGRFPEKTGGAPARKRSAGQKPAGNPN